MKKREQIENEIERIDIEVARTSLNLSMLSLDENTNLEYKAPYLDYRTFSLKQKIRELKRKKDILLWVLEE